MNSTPKMNNEFTVPVVENTPAGQDWIENEPKQSNLSIDNEVPDDFPGQSKNTSEVPATFFESGRTTLVQDGPSETLTVDTNISQENADTPISVQSLTEKFETLIQDSDSEGGVVRMRTTGTDSELELLISLASQYQEGEDIYLDFNDPRLQDLLMDQLYKFEKYLKGEKVLLVNTACETYLDYLRLGVSGHGQVPAYFKKKLIEIINFGERNLRDPFIPASANVKAGDVTSFVREFFFGEVASSQEWQHFYWLKNIDLFINQKGQFEFPATFRLNDYEYMRLFVDWILCCDIAVEYQSSLSDWLGFTKAADTVREAFDKFPKSEVFEKFTDTLKQASDTVSDTSSVTYELCLLGALTYSGYRLAKNPTKLNAIPFCSIVAYIIYRHGWNIYEAFKYCGQYMAKLVEKCVSQFIHWVNVLFKDKTGKENPQTVREEEIEVEPQSVLDWSDVIIDAVSATYTALCAVEAKPAQIASILRMSESLPTYMTRIRDMLLKAINLAFKTRYGMKGGLDNPVIVSLEERVTNLMRQAADGTLALTTQNLDGIMVLRSELMEFQKSIPPGHNFNDLRKHVHDKLGQLWKLEQEFRRNNLMGTGFRQEPVAILLRGGPGVHKSTLIEHLVAAAQAMSLSEEDYEKCKLNPHLYSHNRQFENGYWDGITDLANVVTIDDLGQSRDVPGNPDSEWMNIIRMINSFQMNLNFADCDSKGTKVFKAKFIIASTNLTRLRPESLLCPEAVQRRFMNTLVVIPREQYTVDLNTALYDRQMDHSKLPKSEHGEPNILPEHFWFVKTRFDRSGTEIEQARYSFEQVCALMKQQYVQRQHWLDTHVKNFAITMERARTVFGPDPKIGEEEGEDDPAEETVEAQSADLVVLTQMMVAVVLTCTMATVAMKRTILKAANSKIREVVGESLSFYEWDDSVGATINYDAVNLYAEESVFMIELFKEYLHVRQLHQSEEVSKSLKALIDALISKDIAMSPLWCLWLIFTEYYDERVHAVVLPRVLDEWGRETTQVDIARMMNIPLRPPVLPRTAIVTDVSLVKLWNQTVRGMFSAACGVIDWISENRVTVAGIASLMIAGVAAYKYLNSEVQLDQQMEYDVPQKNRAKKFSKGSLSKFRNNNKVTFQAQDHQVEAAVSAIMKRNSAAMWIDTKEGSSHYVGNVLAIKNNFILYPTHYISNFEALMESGNTLETMKVRFISLEGDLLGKIDAYSLISVSNDSLLEDQDITIAKVENMRPTRDIIGKIVSESEVKRMPPMFTTSIRLPGRGETLERTVFSPHSRLLELKTSAMHIAKAVKYTAVTRKGDCGSLLMYRDKGSTCGKIVGMHVAGAVKEELQVAYAALLTKEAVSEALKEYLGESEIETQVPPEIELDYESSVNEEIRDRFSVFGKAPHVHSPYGNNNLIPSPLQSAGYPVTKLPAMVKMTGGIDPYERALTKFCINGVALDPVIKQKAVFDLERFMLYCPTTLERRVLTLEEGIWGIDETNLTSIKLRTSLGYPLRWEEPNLKRDLYSDDVPRDKSNPKYRFVRNQVREVIKLAKQNRRNLWLFTDNLKVELRSEIKAREGQSRLFSGAPYIYFVVFRMYFGMFMNYMFDQSGENRIGCSLVMNPRSNQWHLLASRLGRFSTERDPMVGAGDFSGFDGSEMPVVHNVILDCINKWYDDGEVNSKIRSVLWKEVTNSRHLVGDTIYEWHSSLPSGHPMTIIINCMYNHFAFRYCWYQLKNTQGLRFSDYVELEVTGDDNIFSVHPDYKEQFNELTLPELMANVGLKYTNEQKGVASYAFRPLTQVSYLKRSFRWEPLISQYVAPHDLESLYSTICYVQGDNTKGNFIERLEHFSKEMCLYPQEEFDKHMQRLIKAVNQCAPEQEQDPDIYRSRIQYLSECYPELLKL